MLLDALSKKQQRHVCDHPLRFTFTGVRIWRYGVFHLYTYLSCLFASWWTWSQCSKDSHRRSGQHLHLNNHPAHRGHPRSWSRCLHSSVKDNPTCELGTSEAPTGLTGRCILNYRAGPALRILFTSNFSLCKGSLIFLTIHIEYYFFILTIALRIFSYDSYQPSQSSQPLNGSTSIQRSWSRIVIITMLLV